MSSPTSRPDPAAFSITAERSLLGAHFLDVAMLSVRAPDGTQFERVAVRHPGAVGVVAIHDERVLLIEQYRAPVDEVVLELPAGKLDVRGEDPALAAVRELEEEVGYTTTRVEHLVSFYTGPGFTDEYIRLYLAVDLTPVPTRPHGAEEEASRLVRVAMPEVPALLDTGAIRDAKTLVGLQALLLRRA